MYRRKPLSEHSTIVAARFLARRPLPAPMREVMVLNQIRVGDEYRYRDVATGRVYTAIEARAIAGPKIVRAFMIRAD